MLIGAFDASGSEHDQPVFIVAGFASSAKDWEEFSALWNQRLAHDGLTHFHAVDFAQSRKEFRDGWKENEPRTGRNYLILAGSVLNWDDGEARGESAKIYRGRNRGGLREQGDVDL